MDHQIKIRNHRTGARNCKGYFTELTVGKGILYLAAGLYVGYCSIACFLLEPFMDFCGDLNNNTTDLGFGNPAYRGDACHHQRYPILLWLSIQECSFGRRIGTAAILGGLIGWERRAEDRPAGIRTMSLVSLGSCLFSICSAFAFLSGPMTWDGSRVSAAIPSGVGFLGAGLIFKNAEKDENGEMAHSVHGITTAASLWISAAVGIACGGELYFAATHSVAVMFLLLRFGPRSVNDVNESEIPEPIPEPAITPPPTYLSTGAFTDPEVQSFAPASILHLSSPPRGNPKLSVLRATSPYMMRENSMRSGVTATHRSRGGRPQLME